ncbi:phospholipid-translocating ATPase [Sesbania bispinosa]|nr:phospholipid-translocating ATPase [Sesbania bispinosa]
MLGLDEGTGFHVGASLSPEEQEEWQWREYRETQGAKEKKNRKVEVMGKQKMKD